MDASRSRASVPAASPVAARIHARLLHNGWDLGDLARAAGLSRTTLHKLLTQGTRFPHRRTVTRIAAALGVSPAELWGDAASGSDAATPGARPTTSLSAARSTLDRATNPCVTEVASESPALFSRWQPADWDQLYSTFGTGGPLTPDGVRAAAARINRRREAVRQLELIMETHLADVAAEFIGTLHRLTKPSFGLPEGLRERPTRPDQDSRPEASHSGSDGPPRDPL
jgi:lambda repressor-like predicted transcriptional regulator